MEIPPGGVVLFHNGLWHTTAPNRLPVSRTQLYFVLRRCGTRTGLFRVAGASGQRRFISSREPPGSRPAVARRPGRARGVEAMFPDETAAPPFAFSNRRNPRAAPDGPRGPGFDYSQTIRGRTPPVSSSRTSITAFPPSGGPERCTPTQSSDPDVLDGGLPANTSASTSTSRFNSPFSVRGVTHTIA